MNGKGRKDKIKKDRKFRTRRRESEKVNKREERTPRREKAKAGKPASIQTQRPGKNAMTQQIQAPVSQAEVQEQ